MAKVDDEKNVKADMESIASNEMDGEGVSKGNQLK
jgi:hypothetical protein